MNNQARQILQQCIRDYGTTLGREPQRLEALLKDYAKGQHKREIFVIVQAAKENVVEQLLNNTAPLELIARSLAHQLTENYGIARELADWAIESWLFALNLSRPINKVKEAQQATTSVNAKPKSDSNPVTSIKSAKTKANNTALIDGRYLDNGDGTVTDQQTGLQWMRCSLGQTWNGTTCQGDAEIYNWDEANQVAKHYSFAGYDDWHLPNIKELESIIEKNKSPSINQHAFPYTPNTSPASIVWSSSPNAVSSYYAWGVHFSYGHVSYDSKSNGSRVRLVRGGQNLSNQKNKVGSAIAAKPKTTSKPVASIKPAKTKAKNTTLTDGRYLNSGDGTVTDQQTGLQWMRCSLGQSWDGTTCQGDAETYNWDEANQVAKNYSFAGYNDWRLPTIDELKSIIEKNKSPSINQHAFPNTLPASLVWSSSPDAHYSGGGWGVGFYDGGAGGYVQSGGGHVCLVRGGQ